MVELEFLMCFLMHKYDLQTFEIKPEQIEEFLKDQKKFISVETFESDKNPHEKYLTIQVNRLTEREVQALQTACKSGYN